MAACATHHVSAASGGLGSAFSLGNCCCWKICCVVSAFPVSLSALPAGDCREWVSCSMPWVHCSKSWQHDGDSLHSSLLKICIPLPDPAPSVCSHNKNSELMSWASTHQKDVIRRHLAGGDVSSPDPMLAWSGPTRSKQVSGQHVTFVLSLLTSHCLSSGSLCETSQCHLRFRSPLWAVRSA